MWRLGRPLVCAIEGTDGLRAWWYANDEDEPEEVDCEEIGGVVVGAIGQYEEQEMEQGEQGEQARHGS